MPSPKIIIFGYDELLLASIDFFSKQNADIVAIVFPSNKTDWRANKIRKTVQEKNFKTLEQPSRNKSGSFAKKLSELMPDIIFAWSYPMILSQKLINIPKYGSINMHVGLLPEYRGVNGVRWALLNDERETGMTLHFMDEGIDTGDIISRVKFPIEADDDILSLMKKSYSAGLYLLRNCWKQIANNTANRTPQDESKANYYSAKMSSINTIDWSKTNVEIRNLIRASAIPFSGVSTTWNSHKLCMREAELIEKTNQIKDFGTIKNISREGIEIITGKGNLLVTKIECEEKEILIDKLLKIGLEIGSRFDQ